MKDKIRGIIQTELTDDQLQPYIDTADVLLTEAYMGLSVSTALRFEVQAWVAAHYIAVTRQRVSTKEEAGTAKIEYAGQYGTGLDSTPWGQTAMALDATGRLKAMNTGKGNIKIIAVKQ